MNVGGFSPTIEIDEYLTQEQLDRLTTAIMTREVVVANDGSEWMVILVSPCAPVLNKLIRTEVHMIQVGGATNKTPVFPKRGLLNG